MGLQGVYFIFYKYTYDTKFKQDVYLLGYGKRFVDVKLTEKNDLNFPVADHRQRAGRVMDFDYVLMC